MFGYTLRAQQDLQISQQKRQSTSSILVQVLGSQCLFLKIKHIRFFAVWSGDLCFRRGSKINSRCYWRWVLSNMFKQNCVHSSTNKISSFYDSEKCETCSHMLNNPFKDKNWQSCWLVEMVHIALQRRRVVTTIKKTISVFEEIQPPITTKHTGIWAKKGKNCSILGIIVSTPHWLMLLTKNSVPFHLLYFKSTVKQQVFLVLEWRYWVVSRLWNRLSYSDCKRFRPWIYNKFPRNFSGTLEIVAVQRENFLINLLARVPITPNQEGTMEMKDEVPQV